jgi:hypothetical protein
MRRVRRARHQHRHQLAETRFQRWIAIDIHLVQHKRKAALERLQRDLHVVAQMAVRAAVQRQLNH